MFIRKRWRSKILILALVVLIFLYWRGIKNVAEQKGWDCNFHVIYATCNAKNNKAVLPSFFDILKAGAKF
jgi:lipopolysaccharide export system protein LptC